MFGLLNYTLLSKLVIFMLWILNLLVNKRSLLRSFLAIGLTYFDLTKILHETLYVNFLTSLCDSNEKSK